eukprot:138335-Chlamydomonas_euryale.AAC.1
MSHPLRQRERRPSAPREELKRLGDGAHDGIGPRALRWRRATAGATAAAAAATAAGAVHLKAEQRLQRDLERQRVEVSVHVPGAACNTAILAEECMGVDRRVWTEECGQKGVDNRV